MHTLPSNSQNFNLQQLMVHGNAHEENIILCAVICTAGGVVLLTNQKEVNNNIIINHTCCGGTLKALALVSTLAHTSIQGLMNTTPV